MTVTQYADVRPMLTLHNALRREFRVLPALVRRVPYADAGRARVVADHIDFLTAVLHAHDHGEDLVLWPILLERGPAEIAPIVHVMEGQHSRIDELTKQLRATLAAWRAGAGTTVALSLADTLDQLLVVLDEHLHMEEDRVLPVVAKHVTMTEWDRMGEAAGVEVDPALRPVAVGMLMYEGDPEAIEVDLARMPSEAREAIRRTAPQAYEAHSLRVHGATLARSAV